jgi:IS5 family transposase
LRPCVDKGSREDNERTFALGFRHLLEEHRLTAAIVDATIIAAPSSTKNAAQARDPEMKQTRKGNTWYFGMKLHVGTDLQGRVHSIAVTHAGIADITQLPVLVHGAERVLYGDQAYWKEAIANHSRPRGRYRVNRRAAAPHKPLGARSHLLEHEHNLADDQRCKHRPRQHRKRNRVLRQDELDEHQHKAEPDEEEERDGNDLRELLLQPPDELHERFMSRQAGEGDTAHRDA